MQSRMEQNFAEHARPWELTVEKTMYTIAQPSAPKEHVYGESYYPHREYDASRPWDAGVSADTSADTSGSLRVCQTYRPSAY